EPGWYVVCDESGRALYVGTAENLNARLNSQNGSRDNFADPTRTTDSVRNFIKTFRSAGFLGVLQVLPVTESSICASLGFQCPLSKLDRCNVEKVIGLFRERVVADRRGPR